MTLALALSLLKRFWWSIPIAALTIAFLFARSDARHWHNLSDQYQAAEKLANDKLAISNASIDTLTAALNDKNAESEARAKAYADSKAEDAATLAEMEARRKQDASRIATLQGLAKDLPDNPNCKAPAALLENLKGL